MLKSGLLTNKNLDFLSQDWDRVLNQLSQWLEAILNQYLSIQLLSILSKPNPI